RAFALLLARISKTRDECMSYKQRLNHLKREDDRAPGERIVEAVREAIASGELAAGEKLPPTRELAEPAGVNHLTAVPVYRKLRELGLVTSEVGRGTFVREAAATLRAGGGPDSTDWQRYVLPPLIESSGGRAMDG